jgi:hypothetical protein
VKKFLGNDDSVTDIYTKLFAGNTRNLPVLNKTGVEYEPIWSDEELDEMRNVMSEGIEIIREAFDDAAVLQ